MYHIEMGFQMCQPEFEVGQVVFNSIWVKATDLLVIPTGFERVQRYKAG